MIKNTNKTQQITIWFGYGLFTLLVLGVISSTIVPWTKLFFQQEILFFNTTVLLVSLVAGALVPILIAYIIGDRSTRARTPILHHYNGVMFGLLAYWLTLVFSSIGFNPVSAVREHISPGLMVVVMNGWTVFATALTVAIIAILYTRSRHKESILEYAPYHMALIVGSLLAAIVLPLANQWYPSDFYAFALISPIVFVLVTIISYLVLRKKKRSQAERISRAIIATTIGFIAAHASSQLMPYAAEADNPLSIVLSLLSSAIGVAAWLIYLVMIRHLDT